MNIHDYVRYGPRKPGYKSKNTAKPPHQRENLTGRGCSSKRSMSVRLGKEKNFAGGKKLRKQLSKLHTRWDHHKPTQSPSGHANTRPGSMTK